MLHKTPGMAVAEASLLIFVPTRRGEVLQVLEEHRTCRLHHRVQPLFRDLIRRPRTHILAQAGPEVTCAERRVTTKQILPQSRLIHHLSQSTILLINMNLMVSLATGIAYMSLTDFVPSPGQQQVKTPGREDYAIPMASFRGSGGFDNDSRRESSSNQTETPLLGAGSAAPIEHAVMPTNSGPSVMQTSSASEDSAIRPPIISDPTKIPRADGFTVLAEPDNPEDIVAEYVSEQLHLRPLTKNLHHNTLVSCSYMDWEDIPTGLLRKKSRRFLFLKYNPGPPRRGFCPA